MATDPRYSADVASVDAIITAMYVALALLLRMAFALFYKVAFEPR